MNSKKQLLDHTAFLFLATGSMVSGLFFLGAYCYAGTVLPSPPFEGETGAIVIWTVWAILLAIPVITVIWLLAFRRRR